jgi:hypothetical protein
MIWKIPLIKTYTVRCPDGSFRTVYKHVNDAFPLFLQGFHGKAQTSLNELKGASATLNAEYQSKVDGLLFSLDDFNQSLMMNYRATYVTYQADPCANLGYLKRQMERLVDQQNWLTTLRAKIRTLVELAKVQPDRPDLFFNSYNEIVGQLGGPGISFAASYEIRINRTAAKKWIGGSHVS